MPSELFHDFPVAIRGGGDLGSGVAYRLHRIGFPVLITELPNPLLVRRAVSFGSAVIENQIEIEGVLAKLITDTVSLHKALSDRNIPTIVDPECASEMFQAFSPAVLVDARLLKHPLTQSEFPGVEITIGLGPGFKSPDNCWGVVETNRGHNLGRFIQNGSAEADTGIPGKVENKDHTRVLRAPCSGYVKSLSAIAEYVEEGSPIAQVDSQILCAPFSGMLRGLIHDGIFVQQGTKIGDLDPRNEPTYCFTISDKALAIGGGVVEGILAWVTERRKERYEVD